MAGAVILSNFRVSLPWVKMAPWQNAATGNVAVVVKATLHDSEGGDSKGAFSSGAPLPKYKHILFQACSLTGLPYSSKDYGGAVAGREYRPRGHPGQSIARRLLSVGLSRQEVGTY